MAIAFKIDDKEYPLLIPATIGRHIQIVDGELAGRNKLAEMIRDIKGTFFNYSLGLEFSAMGMHQYDELINIIADPKKDSHTIVMPFSSTGDKPNYVEFKAYITAADDEIRHMDEKGIHWKNLKLEFIAMKPFLRPD